MRTALLAAALTTLLCPGPVASQTAKSPPPATPSGEARTITPEDILSIRNLDELRLSPDGRQVAFVVTEPADPKQPRALRPSNIWVVPVDGSAGPRPLVPGLRNASAPSWSPDGRTLAFLSEPGEPGGDAAQGTQVYLWRGDGGQVERLTSAAGGVEQFAWSPDGRMVAFTAREQPTAEESARQAAGDDATEVDRHFKPSRLWVMNLAERRAAQVTRQDFEIYGLAWSPDGEELALTTAPSPKPEDSMLYSLVVVSRATGEVVRTLSRNAATIPGLRWSPDGRSLTFFEGPPTKEFASWLAVVPAKGGAVRPLLKEYPGSVLTWEWTPDSKHLVAQTVEGTHQALLTIEAATGAARKLTDVIQSQGNFSLSTNGAVTAYLAQSPRSPTDIWVLTKDASPRRITDFNPQTASWRLGGVREVEWKNSRDGLTRRGVLITPPDFKQGQPYPTIVHTHPGDLPWWTGWHGTWWAWGQLLASRGYVVFLPNTRGVTGEGWRMHQTIADWGGMAYQDLMDGVDELVEKKIADPDRLGIGGWSNGGFMTEYAITHTGRFKAAVALAAHSDFFSLYGTSYLRPGLRYVTFKESPHYDRKGYDERSPITYIRNCRTPTLLLHGVGDAGVPVGQSFEFFYGLRDVGVETEMVVYPRERHSIREYAHQLDLQRRVVAWFDKHLKP